MQLCSITLAIELHVIHATPAQCLTLVWAEIYIYIYIYIYILVYIGCYLFCEELCLFCYTCVLDRLHISYLYSICEINNFISIIIPHQSLFKLIIKNFKRIILSQSVNLLMIPVTTPLLVTYVIAVVSIYMGSQELPPIRNNLNFCYLLFIFPK